MGRSIIVLLMLFVGTGVMPAQTSVETKYDNGVAYTPFTFSTSDTLVVQFDAVPNFALDSVRIAFLQAGSISVGVWKYAGTTGNPRPTPIGQQLVPMTTWSVPAGSANTTPTTEGSVKWVTKDIRASSVTASSPFVVGAIIGANPAAPGVLVAKKNTNNLPDHSFTWFNANSIKQWTFPTDTGGYVWQFMVRVWGHSTVTAVHEPVELTPTGVALAQNFPNPFNPSTRIRYHLASSGHVRAEVVSLTGAVVTVLADRVDAEGDHEVEWNGRSADGVSMPSGVYLVRLLSGGSSVVRKMLLMR